MVEVHRKGDTCQPCGCTDWNLQVKDLWERYQEIVRGVRADGNDYYPDGDGMVRLPGILSDLLLTDMIEYYNLTVDTEIGSISLIEDNGYWLLTIGA